MCVFKDTNIVKRPAQTDVLHVGLLVGCVCHCPVFARSDMPIGLLSAHCGSAQSVMMPGVLVVGGGAWTGGWARGDGALEVRTSFGLCSSCYAWVIQEMVTIVLCATILLFGVGYGQTVAFVYRWVNKP